MTPVHLQWPVVDVQEESTDCELMERADLMERSALCSEIVQAAEMCRRMRR